MATKSEETLRPSAKLQMWELKSGEVVVDRHHSHLHPGVERLLPQALGRIESLGREFFVEEIDFGQPIGKTVCVRTGPADEIVFAKRPKRRGHTRFVLHRAPEPCSSIVVILKAGDHGGYILISAFVGQRPEPEPWDGNATEKSREFWREHALIWAREPVIPGTTTVVCPW